jgi:hypothetical protein
VAGRLGNNETYVALESSVADPPMSEAFGFIGGSGGGMSDCVTQNVSYVTTCLAGYSKPAFQKKISGKYRQLPDISWLADPFTGVAILISVPFQVPEQVWQVWGGTSVAAPMFSALWAIANQEAGAPLGQAAQYVYSLPAGAVTDVVPISSKMNVTGSVVDSSGTTAYTADQILGGDPEPKFVNAIWDEAFLEDTGLVISFGTDCSMAVGLGYIVVCSQTNALHTNKGWDNVTGVGTPNGKSFVEAFAPAAAVKRYSTYASVAFAGCGGILPSRDRSRFHCLRRVCLPDPSNECSLPLVGEVPFPGSNQGEG